MAVSETIVREFFEMHGLLVHQRRKFVAPSGRDEEEIDFLVLNPQPRPAAEPWPFVLGAGELSRISRAIVVVKGWHTETFSFARLERVPGIYRFVEADVLEQARSFFGGDAPIQRLLVLPALPQDEEGRAQSIELLRSKGVDAVLPFRTILADLIARTESNRNYQKSDLLQIIRVLKNYDFFREPQLELFKARRPRRPATPAAEPGGTASAG